MRQARVAGGQGQLAHRDRDLTGRLRPKIKSGEVKPEDIDTEVFFFPAAQVAETEGSFTNTQRMLQWHFKAADPPGDCRTDIVVHPSARQAAEEAVRRQHAAARPGIQESDWDFEPDPEAARDSDRASRTLQAC